MTRRDRPRPDGIAGLSPFLEPRSIAVVGASDEPTNLGGTAIRLLRKFGYPGSVLPVNPRHSTVDGLSTFAGVADLPEQVDLAILAVGAARVVDLIEECADSDILHGIVWAGGFAETGDAGALQQRRLEAVCRARGFTVLGPNCLGVINTALPLTATFASFLVEARELLPGDISIVGQSGGLVTMAQALAQRRGFGFRYTVSTGNEAVLGTAEFIRAYCDDPGTRVIAVYLEGARNGRRLLDALCGAKEAGKPVVVLRGGSTTASALAAAAHTGAVAGEGRVWRAALRDCAIEVSSLEELLDVSLHLSGTGGNVLPKGPRAAIVTFGGGSGVLAADQCAEAGLSVPRLADRTQSKLASLVPPTASVANPVDLTPATFNRPEWLANFPQVLDAIAADPYVDAVLVQCGPMAQGSVEVAESIATHARQSAKTLCLAWPLAPEPIPALLRARGMHVFEEYARAVRTLAGLTAYQQADVPEDDGTSLPDFDWDRLLPRPTVPQVVPEARCHELLAAAGLPVAEGLVVSSSSEAVRAGRALGWPVAIKAISTAATHRAAAGLIVLDVASQARTRQAVRQVTNRARTLGIRLDGIYVQRMEKGSELFLSAFRDPTFGVVVACGAGGELVETVDDVALGLAPLTVDRALAQLRRVRLLQRLEQHDPRFALGTVATLVAEFSRLVASAPWRKFVLELNPVKWDADRAVAVDGLLIVEEL